MKDLKTRIDIIEYLISKLEEVDFVKVTNNDNFKTYYFGDRTFSVLTFSNRYIVEIIRATTINTESYEIKLKKQTPIKETST